MSGIGLSLKDVCSLLCCPPLPSHIAAKLAFLPPESTYSLMPINSDSSKPEYRLILYDRAEWQFSEEEKNKIRVSYIQTSRGNKIATMLIKAPPRAHTKKSRFTLLHSHGNAVDLGQMCTLYVSLAARIGCDIFSYDYSGYGMSNGKPSEQNLYADIEASFQHLTNVLEINPEEIVLYGQSIGTVPTIDLASKRRLGAVILHSALMSGLRVAFPQTKRSWFFDAFRSIDKVPKIPCPVLVIHGTEDEVIAFSHGLSIYEKCSSTVDPLWVEGAGHNDVELYPQYMECLKRFIFEELNQVGNSTTAVASTSANNKT